VYVSGVTLLSACRNDSCTVFTSSPLPFRRVAKECLSEYVPANVLLDSSPFCSGSDVLRHCRAGPQRLMAFLLSRGKDVIRALIVRALRTPVQQ
jgi:hypothetical protein